MSLLNKSKTEIYGFVTTVFLIAIFSWAVNSLGTVDHWFGVVDKQGKFEFWLVVVIAILYLIGLTFLGRIIFKKIKNGKKD